MFSRWKLVCFYIQADFTDDSESSTIDGSDFVVREYGRDEELAPLARPAELGAYSFRPVTWELADDYPSVDKYYELFDEAVYDSVCEADDYAFENHSGIKIGGWPTPLQRRQQDPGSCDLQIDMTETFMYCDSGIGYLSRLEENWFVEFETC